MSSILATKRSHLAIAFAFMFCVAASLIGSSHAQQDRQLVQRPSQAGTNAKRIALIIGNGAYTNAPPLKNPPNDARDMAKTLRELGFDVTSGIDVNQRDFKRLVREFGQKLKSGGSGLFYYAGHGVQSKGRNFLIPVDADIQSEAEVEDTAVDVNLVLGYMDDAQNGLNIVILDACRNNPFSRSFRSATTGLAQVDAPTGTLIAYATAPGRVASDGQGENGLYTSQLLRQMRVPGLSVTDMFMHVRAEVMKQTAGKQVPWEASSLIGNFYFGGTSSSSSANNSDAQPAAVEISDEAHHHLKLENEFVRLWEVNLAPQDATLWHTHHNDSAVISFSNATLNVETVGAATGESHWKFGEVRFSKATYIHRATNIGTTPFHNFTIELLKSPAGNAAKSNEPTIGSPVLENDRIRVYRTTLQPGQSTPMTAHLLPRIAVAMTAGDLEVTNSGSTTTDRISRVAGDIRWRPTALTFSLKNVGQTTFENIEIELKPSDNNRTSSATSALAGCFASNPAAGSTDWNSHYQWAQSQTLAKLKTAIQQKFDLVFNCSNVSDDKAFDDFGAISVIIVRHVPNAACFNGDAGVVATDPSGHRNWARERGRAAALANLKSKAAAALDCLEETKRASYYADVSVFVTGGAPK